MCKGDYKKFATVVGYHHIEREAPEHKSPETAFPGWPMHSGKWNDLSFE
jgi:hypothetical protein